MCYANDSNNTMVKICKNYEDDCFSLVTREDGMVKDCLKDYVERKNLPIDFISTNYDQSVFEVCSTPLCNTQTVDVDVDVDADTKPDSDANSNANSGANTDNDGNDKGSPDTKVNEAFSCFACDSNEDQTCCDNPKNLKECSAESKTMACYHFIDGDHVKRGCLEDLKNEEEQKSCASNSDKCKHCSETECNKKSSFQSCLTTDRQNITNYAPKICNRYLDECFIHLSNEEVRRGCLIDFIDWPVEGIDIKADCENKDMCEKCTDKNNCNDRNIADEYCLVCKSEEGKYCGYFWMKGNSKKCPKTLNPMGCYLANDKEAKTTDRGCVSQLEAEKQIDCQEGKNDCVVCMGNYCNKRTTFQNCYACNSEDSNSYECMNKPWLTASLTCSNYKDQCYTQYKDGIMKRGCTGDEVIPDPVKCTNDPEHCTLCSDTNACNEDRLYVTTCIYCDSTVDPTCATNTTFTEFKECPRSLHAQQCYHMIDAASGAHKRGELRIESTPKTPYKRKVTKEHRNILLGSFTGDVRPSLIN